MDGRGVGPRRHADRPRSVEGLQLFTVGGLGDLAARLGVEIVAEPPEGAVGEAGEGAARHAAAVVGIGPAVGAGGGT